MKKKNKAQYFSKKGLRNHLKSAKRRERFRREKASYRGTSLLRPHKSSIRLKRNPYFHKESPFAYNKAPVKKVEFSRNIKFLSEIPHLFSPTEFKRKNDGNFMVPHCFSLLDNYEESFKFLKKLFTTLYHGKTENIVLDYNNCERIDVDASICMDIILGEFIKHITTCRKRNLLVNPSSILPKNFEKDNVKKVLFSIGAYTTLKDISIAYGDIEALPVLINNRDNFNWPAKSEIDTTKIVEYIKRCLERMNKELSVDSETELYKVIGEIMSNAEEHGSLPQRYAIGLFQETHNVDDHFGVFNFSIFNFGKTIYDTFKSPDCLNKKAVDQMVRLSEVYTKKGLFKKAKFEEETLWTLYSLQEGVTSKAKKRGNGSIQYIENFFKLKGDSEKDNISKLVIMSGNTRILFDGTYNIIPKKFENQNHTYKIITFNESGQISDEPDKEFVTFAPNYFPGTLISARILIKFTNTNN